MGLKRLQRLLAEKDIDLALFFNLAENKNVYYFTGYEGLGCLAVPKKKPPFIIVPMMEYERAKKYSKVAVLKADKSKRFFDVLRAYLKKKRINAPRIGMVYADTILTVVKSLRKAIRGFKLIDISEHILKLREIKSEKEVKLIKKSCQITSEILNECLSKFNRLVTEKDVETFLHRKTVERGCSLAFPPIVASGKASSMPHYTPRPTRLRRGFCLIDFGVVYRGYNSDITRTLYLGKPSKNEKNTYNFLLSVQDHIIKNIKVGKKCADIYDEAVDLLGKYAKNFTHGLGHGIGLDIHELPNLKADEKDVIRKRAAFTVEPGIYFSNRYGIRIEDSILASDKINILTKVPKELTIK